MNNIERRQNASYEGRGTRQSLKFKELEEQVTQAELLANSAKDSADAAKQESVAAKAQADAAKTAADKATQSAATAQAAASAAENAVNDVKKDVADIAQTAANAKSLADSAKETAGVAQAKADDAAQAASNAQKAADNASLAAGTAQSTADSAITKAGTAQSTADQAKKEAETVQSTIDAVKQDVANAEQEISGLAESLDTLSNTMEADYAKKTELTSVEASLTTKISQNAAQISSTAQKLTVVDETANDAAEQAKTAQSTAEAAQAQAEQATSDASKAQTAADAAALAATNAQTEADNAKAAASAAQSVADQANTDLAAAKEELEAVTSRVGATEEDIAAAQTAVSNAQAAADKAQTDAQTAASKAAAAQSTADTAKANAETAKSAADAAASAASAAQEAADTAQGDATAAKDAANKAAAAAANAQSTADTAKANAATAQVKADSAASAAATAQTAADAAKAKADAAQSDLDTAKANLTEVTSRVDATEEEIAAAEKAVATAQAAADQAKADAATAQSTADTAKANAATAQTAANNAKTAADNAQKAADTAKSAADKAQADADALAIRMTNAETNITQNADAIKLSATKLEVAETLGGYYTKEQADAAIEVSANAVKTTVSNTYATKSALATTDTKAANAATAASNAQSTANTAKTNAATAQSTADSAKTAAANAQTAADNAQSTVDNLTIGGRNLVAGTSLDTIYSGNKGTGTYKDVWSRKSIDALGGTEYVVSFYAKADEAIDIRCYFYSPNTTTSGLSSTGQISTGGDGNCIVSIGTEWERYWVKYTQTAASTQKGIIVGRNYNSANVYIKAVKLEEGNSPTSWTPAPEDMATEADLTTLETRVTQTESSIKSQATSISGHETRISTVEQTASGLTVRLDTTDKNVSAAQSTADAAQTAASKAQTTANTANSTANTAKTNAATAQSTADAAKTAANAAQSTADTAKTNAASAQSTANTARTEAAAAAKTATNYLKYDSSGLLVGNMAASTLGQNILIGSDKIEFRSGTTVLARYAADKIELGLNSESSIISFCGGLGTIAQSKDYSGNNALGFEAMNLLLKSKSQSGKYFSQIQADATYSESGAFSNASLRAYNSDNNALHAIVTAESSENPCVLISARLNLNNSIIQVYPSAITLTSNKVSLIGDVTILGTNSLTVGGAKISTGASASIIGTTKQATLISNQVVLQGGAVFSGSAAAAGLVTRGICGVTTPDGNGACTKENLYINYDSTNTYNSARQVILQAGTCGTHYGSNLYQYAAARGDAVKGWVESQSYIKSSGGTITGGLQIDGTVITNGASASSSAGKIVILNDNNELHTRTTAQILSDIGAASSSHTHSYLPLSGGTITGALTANSTLKVLGNFTASNGTSTLKNIELYSSIPYIDFHFNNSTADYTTRLAEYASGTLTVNGSFYVTGTVSSPNTFVNTSDRRVKENIVAMGENMLMTLPLDDEESEVYDMHSELFDRLKPVQYNFIGKTRICYGLVAQDVVEAMEELGISEAELDLVHHDVVVTEENGEPQDMYGIAYTNLIALLIHEVQKLKARIARLEA